MISATNEPVNAKRLDNSKRIESPKKQITGKNATKIEFKMFKSDSLDENDAANKYKS